VQTVCTTHRGNAVVGFIILGVLFAIIAALVVLLIRAPGRANRAEGEVTYLRMEVERLRTGRA
jgi:hypothetical protein